MINDILIGGTPIPACPWNSMAIGFRAGLADAAHNSVALGSYAWATKPNTFVVAWGNFPVQVTIHADGKIELPAEWKLDATAKSFWDALSSIVSIDTNSMQSRLQKLEAELEVLRPRIDF